MRVQQIVEDPLMRHSAILVFANKQDLVSVHDGFCHAQRPKPGNLVVNKPPIIKCWRTGLPGLH